MDDMLFEDVNGKPVARRPVSQRTGEARVADGVRFFSLDQAVGHFPSYTRQALREEYCEALGDDAVDDIGGPPAGSGEKPPAGKLTREADYTLRQFLYGYLEDHEFEVWMQLCKEHEINPWAKNVIPKVIVEGEARRVEYITTIVHLRTVASRHSWYKGQTGPEWCGEDGVWKDVWTAPKGQLPVACRVGIKRRDTDDIQYGIVRWDELGAGGGEGLPEYYHDKPTYMMGIRAEATAIRRAFLTAARLYLSDEIKPREKPLHPDVKAIPHGQAAAAYEPPRQRYREEERDDGRRVVYDGEPEYFIIEPPRVRRRVGVG